MKAPPPSSSRHGRWPARLAAALLVAWTALALAQADAPRTQQAKTQQAKTHQVCAACELTTLRAAIARSAPGDRIEVGPGVYREGNLLIDKPLELVGRGGPVLDGEHEVEIMTVTADEVSVRGFVFRDSGVSHVEDLAALKIFEANDCVVEDNRFENSFFAIYLGRAAHCRVQRNTVVGRARAEAFSGNAIHLWNCIDVRVEQNHLRGHRDGIYLEFVRDSLIAGNTSQDNLRYGLHFMFSNENEFRDNTFRRNGAGVAVMYSKSIVMTRNRFEDNWGGSAYGLLLKEIDDSFIAGNTFDRNTVGVYLDGSNRTSIDRNDFLANGYALRVLSSSMAVTVTHNNFVGNTFDVTTNADRSYNAFIENYWDAYDGYDLDRDGIGDVPYRPVRLFAMTVENYPQTMMLLRSPLAQMMDYAERVLPVFTPKAIEDDRPLMRRIRWSPLNP